MTETASGFVRIATLLLVMAVFAIVWRGDQRAQQQFIAARKAAAQRESMLAQRSAHSEAAEQLHDGSPQFTPAPRSAGEPIAAPEASRIGCVEIEMELPADIAAGTYQIVDQSGQMQTVRIQGDEQTASRRDLYILDREEVGRRYFIRISDSADASHARTASGSTSFLR